jgi:sulfate/thiosulfate transport system ATP-binding protein
MRFRSHSVLPSFAPFGIKLAFNPISVVIALTFIGLPFVVSTMQPVLKEHERELEEADRVVLMNAGQIEQFGTPQEVYEKPATEFVHRFLGTVNLFHGKMHRGQLNVSGETLTNNVSGQTAADVSAIAYVRPHELELLPVNVPHGIPATVVRILPFGAAYRVEVTANNGVARTLIEVDVPREQVSVLELLPGKLVKLVACQVQLYQPETKDNVA